MIGIGILPRFENSDFISSKFDSSDFDLCCSSLVLNIVLAKKYVDAISEAKMHGHRRVSHDAKAALSASR